MKIALSKFHGRHYVTCGCLFRTVTFEFMLCLRVTLQNNASKKNWFCVRTETGRGSNPLFITKKVRFDCDYMQKSASISSIFIQYYIQHKSQFLISWQFISIRSKISFLIAHSPRCIWDHRRRLRSMYRKWHSLVINFNW